MRGFLSEYVIKKLSELFDDQADKLPKLSLNCEIFIYLIVICSICMKLTKVYRNPWRKGFSLDLAKDLFKWGTGAIMTGCSS